jgi:hypothetical protein
MLALLKNLYPERTGLINRWHYVFSILDPETHSLDFGNPYSLSCQNSHAMEVLIVSILTPIGLPRRKAILAAEPGPPPSWARGRCFLQGNHDWSVVHEADARRSNAVRILLRGRSDEWNTIPFLLPNAAIFGGLFRASWCISDEAEVN